MLSVGLKPNRVQNFAAFKDSLSCTPFPLDTTLVSVEEGKAFDELAICVSVCKKAKPYCCLIEMLCVFLQIILTLLFTNLLI